MRNFAATGGPARPRAKRWELTVRRGRKLRRHERKLQRHALLCQELDRQGPSSWGELPWSHTGTEVSTKQVPAPTQASGADHAVLSVDERMLRLTVHYGLARSTVEYPHLPWPQHPDALPPHLSAGDFISRLSRLSLL